MSPHDEERLAPNMSDMASHSNKNARRPKEAQTAKNLKEIKILDRAGEDLKELDKHQRFRDELKEMKKNSKELELTNSNNIGF